MCIYVDISIRVFIGKYIDWTRIRFQSACLCIGVLHYAHIAHDSTFNLYSISVFLIIYSFYVIMISDNLSRPVLLYSASQNYSHRGMGAICSVVCSLATSTLLRNNAMSRIHSDLHYIHASSLSDDRFLLRISKKKVISKNLRNDQSVIVTVCVGLVSIPAARLRMNWLLAVVQTFVFCLCNIWTHIIIPLSTMIIQCLGWW